jgi:exopolyphosphatase/guanosine-5'-triphosphate,3'-diphosphate pyrophosphatase
VIPYPIEIISGNEEARLIFMGVEHTQPERGRKLVIDIGGGSTELVIGEDFEPRLVESRRMGCVSFSQIYFPAAPSTKRISSARVWRRCRSWKRWPGSSAFRAGTWRWAHPAPLKPRRKCWWPWVKDGFITPERLEMLVEEVLKHKNFDALSLPGLSEDRKAVFAPGWLSCAAF